VASAVIDPVLNVLHFESYEHGISVFRLVGAGLATYLFHYDMHATLVITTADAGAVTLDKPG